MRNTISTAFSISIWAGLLVQSTAQAALFEPSTELFRPGVNEMLIIDRGGPVDQAGDINGDGADDVIIASGIGGVRVVFGPNSGDNGFLEVTSLNGRNGFALNGDGPYVAGLGDINRDGFDDIAIGSAVATYVVFGGGDAFSSFFDVTTLNGQNGFVFNSPTTAVSDAGDINNDGIADFIVANADASPNGLNAAGESYVIYGSVREFPASFSPSSLNGSNGFTINGIEAYDRSGSSAASAGDFNGDGVDDFMLGAPFATRNGIAEAGQAYLILGASNGFPATINLSDINGQNGFVFTGDLFESATGYDVAGVGDINHDGMDDVAIGAPAKGHFGAPTSHPGEVYVLFGGQNRNVNAINKQALNGDNGFIIRGVRGGVVPAQDDQPGWGDMVGQSIDAIGDINNDGMDDLVIGASQTIINPQRTGNGSTYILYGSNSGFERQMSLASLNGENGFALVGIGTTDYSGFSVSKAGDFSGDGIADIVIGAAGQGHSYVYYGKATGVDRINPVYAQFSEQKYPAVSVGFPLAEQTGGNGNEQVGEVDGGETEQSSDSNTDSNTGNQNQSENTSSTTSTDNSDTTSHSDSTNSTGGTNNTGSEQSSNGFIVDSDQGASQSVSVGHMDALLSMLLLLSVFVRARIRQCYAS